MGLFSRKGPGGLFGGGDSARQVNEPACAAFGEALARLGQVVHADEPQRAVSMAYGGPPVWSVAFVSVPGPKPYTLVVTFGLSYTLSPESDRAGVRYELSIAVPHGEPVTPWADAFLRGQAHYVVTQKAELKLGDCIPFRGVPITRMAFAPEHAMMQPDTSLVGMLVAQDPAIPTVQTPAGEVEVRRLVGIDQAEIDRAVTWDPAQFLELVRAADPLLLSPLQRPSLMPGLAATIEPRAQRDGSSVEGVLLELAWKQDGNTVRVALPPPGAPAQRTLAALRGRLGFKRKLVAFSTVAPAITFSPGAPGIDITPQGLELVGDLTTPPISQIVDGLTAGAPSVDLALVAPPPARVRSRFFEKVTATVRANELDQQRMTKELMKLVHEAHGIAQLESQVPAADRDADRAAANAAIRALRFARTTDQSAIETLIPLITPK